MGVEETLEKIRKRFDERILIYLGEIKKEKVEVIPTGALTLDAALGVGGIPRGRVTEVYGPEMGGKTTLCQHLTANAQQMGGNVAYLDAEQCLDLDYAKRCGVNIDDLYLSQIEVAEDVLNLIEMLIRSGDFMLVILDSVAALAPRAELEGEIGDAHIALQPRLMAQLFRNIMYALRESSTALVLTNQVREKIGGFSFGGVTPTTTPGGRAMKHFTSIRLDMRAGEWLGPKTAPTGRKVRVRVAKNKVAPPLQIAEFEIMYDRGINKELSVLEAAVKMGVIEARGAHYYRADKKVGHGKESMVNLFKEKPSLMEEIETEVRNKLWNH